MKHCKYCNQEKQLSEFTYHSKTKDKLTHICNSCAYQKSQLWREQNREKVRKYNNEYAKKQRDINKEKYWDKELRHNFNISYEEYKDLLIYQNNSCAICGKHQSEIKNRLAVDHCHKTQKIRGLLCSACNTGLGFFKDNRRFLRQAIKYLKNNS